MDNSFGVFLKNYRNEKKLSIRELAKKSGVSHGYISQLENGDKQPSKDIVKKLANALLVSVNEMLLLAGYAREQTPKEILIDKYHTQSLFVKSANSTLENYNAKLRKAKTEGDLESISFWEKEISAMQKELNYHRDLYEIYLTELAELEGLTTSERSTNQMQPTRGTENLEVTFKVPKLVSEEEGSIKIERTLSDNEALIRFFDLKNLLTVSKYINYDGQTINEVTREQILKALQVIFE